MYGPAFGILGFLAGAGTGTEVRPAAAVGVGIE